MIGLKSSITKLEAYNVPQDQTYLKLNQNESPFDIPNKIKFEIMNKINTLNWNRYPDANGDSLRKKISEYTNHDLKGILLGNGSNELIQALIHSTCNTGDTLLISSPTFSVYQRIASIMDIQTIKVSLKPNFEFDPNAIITAGKNAKLVILDSPNNPIGSILQLDSIKKIAANIPGILAIDEAYYEFSLLTAQPLLKEIKNLVILRTFSKAFSAAGIRLGYMLGNEERIIQLSKTPLPFSVGLFQQTAGEILLKYTDIIRKKAIHILEEQKKVFLRLKMLKGIFPFPSYTNYISFKSEQIPSDQIFLRLKDHGILIRRFTAAELKNILRVTIGASLQNQVFLEKMIQFVEEGEK